MEIRHTNPRRSTDQTEAILGRGVWDAGDLRDVVRDYALETLADDDAVLVIDETGFLKQGKASCAGCVIASRFVSYENEGFSGCKSTGRGHK